MRRWIGNQLILLAYSIEPKLNTELNAWIETALKHQAETAAEQAVNQLLEHQHRAACIAARQ